MDAQPRGSDKVLLDSCVFTCLLAVRGKEWDHKPHYVDLLKGMQYVVCPVTEAESWHTSYANHLGPKRLAEHRKFLDDAEYLLFSSSTAKIYADIAWPRGGHEKPGQNDQWLVALALEHGIPLATKDTGLADLAKDIITILHVSPEQMEQKSDKS